MKLVTCITRAVKLKEIIDALTAAGIVGMTVTDVHGYGKQGGQVHHFRGSAYEVRLLPKVRVDLALADGQVPLAIGILMNAARTGEAGDGKVFVLPLEEAYRIRTGESGEEVL
jgi:nitrogen regulatory protein PII